MNASKVYYWLSLAGFAPNTLNKILPDSIDLLFAERLSPCAEKIQRNVLRRGSVDQKQISFKIVPRRTFFQNL